MNNKSNGKSRLEDNTVRTQVQRFLAVILLIGGFIHPALAGTFSVTSLADDSGVGTLRQGINTGATNISFAVNGLIVLTSGQLVITNSMSVVGPGATNLAISGNYADRVFSIGGNASTEVGPMNGPHDGHTATLLSDGSVLIVGGPGYEYPVSAAEQYLPSSIQWSNVSVTNLSPRFGHTATLLNDGQTVLVAGGADPSNAKFDPASAQTFLQDVSNGPTWTPLSDMNTARYDHTATLVTNGLVLVAGGNSTNMPTASVELYDPTTATGSWANTMPLNVARESHTATLLTNGQVLVVGGLGVSSPLSSVELLTLGTWSWSLVNPLNVARYGQTATRLNNGMVLVVGGLGMSGPLASVELYNPVSGTWTLVNSLTTARFHHTATLLASGKVLVAGGSDETSPLASAELFDPGSRTWTAASPLTLARQSHSATLLANGAVLFAGGDGSTGPLVSAELYQANSGITVNISGVTIRDGHAPDGIEETSWGVEPWNLAAGSGGGINNAGILTLINCILTNNSAGNGLAASSGNGLTLPAGNGGDGGAINNAGSLTLVNCTLDGNAGGSGGNGASSIYGSTTLGWLAAGLGGNGGAINNLGTLTVSNCTFYGNQAGAAGGGPVVGNGSDGVGGGNGGAIFNVGHLAAISATMGGNSAGTGGSGGNGGRGGDGGSGGAIFNASGQTPPNLRNSLIALNNPGAGGSDGGGGPGAAGAGPDLSGSFLTLGHNLLGQADGSNGLTNGLAGDLVGSSGSPLNPLLGPLQANGGATPTMALSPSSPAVYAGDDSLSGTTDQRGVLRPAGLHVDIGAYELILHVSNFSAPVITSFAPGTLTQDPTTRLYALSATARVNAGGLPSAVFFAYGASPNYGNTTPAVAAGSATTDVQLNLSLNHLMPGTIYHYTVAASNDLGTTSIADRTLVTGLLGDFGGVGVVSQSNLNVVYSNYLAASPWLLITNTAGLGGTDVVFSVASPLGATYAIQYSTDLVNWYRLGLANPLYQFDDTNAPASPKRFYRLVFP